MSQKIDLVLDASTNTLVAAGAAVNGTLPTLTRNDVYTLRVRLMETDPAGYLRDLALTSPSLKLGIGDVGALPSDGQFKLTLSATTSSAITYNASALDVYNAISGIAGTGCTVALYGSESSAWIVTAATANTALSFGADVFTLFPASSLLINTRRAPASGIKAQQVVKVRRNPAVYADTFTAAATANVVTMAKVQDGGTSLNETYRLTVGTDAEGGSVVLAFGVNSTTAIPLGSTAASFTEALSAVTGIGAGNVSVESANNNGEYLISFVRSLGQTNVTTALTLDASGVRYARFYESTVTMATAELDELFASAGAATITPTLEVELSLSGKPRTIYQGSVTVRADLITTGAAVPAGLAQYYTKAEADALFVEDADTGAAGTVDASNRALRDSSGDNSVLWGTYKLEVGGVESVDWQNRELKDISGNASVKWKDRVLYDATNASTAIIWDDERIAFGYDTAPAVDFGYRQLKGEGGVVLDWAKGYTTSVTLTFSSVPASGSTTVTAALTGAVTNSLVLLGLPTATCAGLTFQGAVSGSGVIKITAFNVTAAAVTQSAQTFRLTAFGY